LLLRLERQVICFRLNNGKDIKVWVAVGNAAHSGLQTENFHCTFKEGQAAVKHCGGQADKRLPRSRFAFIENWPLGHGS